MGDWRTEAACRGEDPETWFPSDRPGRSRRDHQATDAAVAVCMGCGVREACLRFALEVENGLPRDMRFGVFGGATALQRARIAAGMSPTKRQTPAGQRPPCGTRQGREAHRKRRERACEDCLAAAKAYHRAYYQRRRGVA